MGCDKPAVRTEFARVCYLYSCLIRGEEIGGEGIGDRGRRGFANIDSIVFLPLETKDRFVFVSQRAAGDGARAAFDRVDIETLEPLDSRTLLAAAADFVQRLTGDGGPRASEEERADEGSVRAVELKADECRRRVPGLIELLESVTAGNSEDRRARRGITQLLLIRQMVEDTPDCLIVLSRRGRAASFEDQDADIESATQLLFETYRVSRLQGFTAAYRELVDQRLLLGAQLAELQKVRQHLGMSLGRSPEPMEEFFYLFCQSLVRAQALPEMDNALFFPLVGQKYYLYRPRARRSGGAAEGSLLVEDLTIDVATADAVLASKVETSPDNQNCRRLFRARVRHLSLARAAEASGEDLRGSLDELKAAIWEPLRENAEVAKQEKGLIGYVDAALFSLARWNDWAFEEIEPRFVRRPRMGEGTDEAEAPFGGTGSLLALTIFFDHLPLGIVFLNSGLSGAFGKEDRLDVGAIAKAYFQTFQLGVLSKIVHDYQGLEEQMSIAAFQRTESSEPALEFDRSLQEYVSTLFRSFPSSLEACVWLPLDRDDVHFFGRDSSCAGGILPSKERLESRLGVALESEGERKEFVGRLLRGLEESWQALEKDRKRLEEVRERLQGGRGAEQTELEKETDELTQRIAQHSLRWVYRWAMLQGAREEVPAGYPNLEEIPARVLRVTRAPGALQAHLAAACFDACIIDDELPFLRRLLAVDERHGALLRSRSGSLIGFVIFYDGLPKGILLLASSAEFSFTAEIELRDALLATRAFFLPVQMVQRERVIGEYQRLLLEKGSPTRDQGEVLPVDATSLTEEGKDILEFMTTMQEALPTMRSGLFIPLNSDWVYGLMKNLEGKRVAESWSCSREVSGFGTRGDNHKDGLTARIDIVRKDVTSRDTGKGAAARGEIDKLEIRLLFLLSLRDVLEGRRFPKNFGLDEVVERICGPELVVQPEDHESSKDHAPEGLRTYTHASCWATCAFQDQEGFPGLDTWLDLHGDEKPVISNLKQFWKGRGSLLAIGLLNEGLPLGIMLLGSDIPGSFGEQERLDVEAAAKVFFRQGQIEYRDDVITTYREIVRDVLSEDGMSREIEELRREAGYDLGDDEFGAFLAYFTEILFRAYEKDPPSDIVFFPLDGEHIYVALPAGREGRSRPCVQRIPAAGLELGGKVFWADLRLHWLQDTIAHLARGVEDLETRVESASTPEAALAALRERVDLCLRTILLRGHRYSERVQAEDRQAYLSPFAVALADAGVKWGAGEAGSLLITAMLYDRLPAGGLLIMNSPIPWRFIEQDRVDVEAVAKAYFLTYRSICLKREAERAGRLSGMQQVLLGVTHRLRNDLQATFTVLDSMADIEHKEAEVIGREVLELNKAGQIATGTQGLEQVQKKFAMLRSIVTGGRQPKKARTLGSVAEKFTELVELYKRRLPMLFERFETEAIEVKLNEVPSKILGDRELSRLVVDPEGVWVDVSDGIDEVLAIYAENAVRAVGDHASPSREIFFWFAEPSASTPRVTMALFDRVVIPREKMAYIIAGEAIPTEVGGGSGTGFYNARNLLEINQDGKQVIQSSAELNGTLIHLPLARLIVREVRVPGAQVEATIRSSLDELKKHIDLSDFAWSFENRPSPWWQLGLYEGSYLWSRELFNLTWQIFIQRKENLRRKDTLPEQYAVSIAFHKPADDRAVTVEFRDTTRTGFFKPWAGKLGIDQFSRNHNHRSLVEPHGAVGELFVAMMERLEKTCGIEIIIGKGKTGCTAISMTIPIAWRSRDASTVGRGSERYPGRMDEEV